MKYLPKICVFIALVCIIIAAFATILAIWGVFNTQQLLWRTLATLGVVFLSSLFISALTKFLSKD